MSLVENIKSLAQKNGTTIPKLEKEFGFGKGAMYNWDKNSPSIDKIEKVADYFKVSTDYLLGKTDIKNWDEVFPSVWKKELTPAEQEKLKRYKHHLSSNLELSEDAKTNLYEEEFQLVARYRKLSLIGQQMILDMLTSLEKMEKSK
jgi:transcriptional regulator with XRE-family HTH domain